MNGPRAWAGAVLVSLVMWAMLAGAIVEAARGLGA